MSSPTNSPAIESALAIINQNNGMIRMAAAVRAGIHRNTLQKMLEREILIRESRGLYRLADKPPLGNPDLVTVAAKVPKGVICLISALSIHELTTQIPHEVYGCDLPQRQPAENRLSTSTQFPIQWKSVYRRCRADGLRRFRRASLQPRKNNCRLFQVPQSARHGYGHRSNQVLQIAAQTKRHSPDGIRHRLSSGDKDSPLSGVDSLSKRKPANVAASVRARLAKYAKETSRPFQEVLQYFAMERFLARLSNSEHSDKFVLKGGLMFAVLEFVL